MSSAGFRQNSPGYFIAIDVTSVYNYTNGTFSNQTGWSRAGVGDLLRDMGTTVVTNGSTFRKVQKVIQSPETFGVGGDETSGEEYLTGYIILGYEGNGAPSAVAAYGK